MQKSVVSQNMSNPSMFPLPDRVQYLPVFIYSPENFLISNFVEKSKLEWLGHVESKDEAK